MRNITCSYFSTLVWFFSFGGRGLADYRWQFVCNNHSKSCLNLYKTWFKSLAACANILCIALTWSRWHHFQPVTGYCHLNVVSVHFALAGKASTAKKPPPTRESPLLFFSHNLTDPWTQSFKCPSVTCSHCFHPVPVLVVWPANWAQAPMKSQHLKCIHKDI